MKSRRVEEPKRTKENQAEEETVSFFDQYRWQSLLYRHARVSIWIGKENLKTSWEEKMEGNVNPGHNAFAFPNSSWVLHIMKSWKEWMFVQEVNPPFSPLSYPHSFCWQVFEGHNEIEKIRYHSFQDHHNKWTKGDHWMRKSFAYHFIEKNRGDTEWDSQ